MDINIIPQQDSGCNLTLQGDNYTVRGDGSSTVVPYHRHCQATVLSANGTEAQNGLTWDILSVLDLPNLPSGWLTTYFAGNTNNITEDLAGILKLIDKVVQNWGQYNIKIIDDDNTVMWDKLLNSSSTIAEFKPNRKITFDIGGIQKDFTTIRSTSGQYEQVVQFDSKTVAITNEENVIGQIKGLITNEEFPNSIELNIRNNKLAITKNGNTHGLFDVRMDESRTVDVSHQWPIIPTTDVTGPSTPEVTVNVFPIRDYSIYKISSSVNFNLGVNLTNIDILQFKPTKYMVTYEVHITNTGSSPIKIDMCTNTREFTLTPLTDLLTIDAGKTNAYVFRCDRSRGETKKHVYSLAYIY